MVASRRAARSTRRTCRQTRTARSQHASLRSAAASTRIVERRGPSRREGSAWTVDGTRARPRHRRRRTQDSCGAGRRDRRAIIFAISRKQQQRLPRSKVNRWLRLAAPCFLALGDDGQRHRPSSTRAHLSHRTSRCGGRAVLDRRKHEVKSCFGPGAGPSRSAIVGPDLSARFSQCVRECEF